MDIAGLKRDKAALDRAIGELKKAVEDVSGDIAGIGDDLIVLVPSGIKIDREKVVGRQRLNLTTNANCPVCSARDAVLLGDAGDTSFRRGHGHRRRL